MRSDETLTGVVKDIILGGGGDGIGIQSVSLEQSTDPENPYTYMVIHYDDNTTSYVLDSATQQPFNWDQFDLTDKEQAILDNFRIENDEVLSTLKFYAPEIRTNTGTFSLDDAVTIKSNTSGLEVNDNSRDYKYLAIQSQYTDQGSVKPKWVKLDSVVERTVNNQETDQSNNFGTTLPVFNLPDRDGIHWGAAKLKASTPGTGVLTIYSGTSDQGTIALSHLDVIFEESEIGVEKEFIFPNPIVRFNNENLYWKYSGTATLTGHIDGGIFKPFAKAIEQEFTRIDIATIEDFQKFENTVIVNEGESIGNALDEVMDAWVVLVTPSSTLNYNGFTSNLDNKDDLLITALNPYLMDHSRESAMIQGNVEFTGNGNRLKLDGFNIQGTLAINPTGDSHIISNCHVTGDFVVGYLGVNVKVVNVEVDGAFLTNTSVMYIDCRVSDSPQLPSLAEVGSFFKVASTGTIWFKDMEGWHDSHCCNVYACLDHIKYQVDWVISSTTTPPSFFYPTLDLPQNLPIVIEPVESGTSPDTFEYSLVGGSLPEGIVLDPQTGNLSGIPITISSGNASIQAKTPAGVFVYEWNWGVTLMLGRTEFLNTEILYPALKISTSDFPIGDPMFTKLEICGTLTWATHTFQSDSIHPIYARNDGNGTYSYIIKYNNTFYWHAISGVAIAPENLVNGVQLTYSEFDLITPYNDEFMAADGKTYPSDPDDIHYYTSQHYLQAESTSSFNGFMSGDHSWSFGFHCDEEIDADGLGRVMFSRDPRNYVAFRLGPSKQKSQFIVGNGSALISVNFSKYETIPAGSAIVVTFDSVARVMKLYINDERVATISEADDALDSSSASDSLDVTWGQSVVSNTHVTPIRSFGKWQGLISYLWVIDYEMDSDDVDDQQNDPTNYPTNATNVWPLGETTGNRFSATVGNDLIGFQNENS